MGKFSLGMGHWPLRTPAPLQSILWPIIDHILVTFNNKITTSLTTNLPIYKIPIYQNFLTTKIPSNMRPRSCNYRKCNPIIVNPVVKIRPHPATSPLAYYQQAPPSPFLRTEDTHTSRLFTCRLPIITLLTKLCLLILRT